MVVCHCEAFTPKDETGKMRMPKSALVVDAAVLIAAALGRNAGAVATAAQARDLVVTERSLAEAHRRVELGLKLPNVLPALARIGQSMTIVPLSDFEGGIDRAEAVLRDAVASQNGSSRDAHILACAWTADADIWSFDRDFAGSGVASWSTANLMRALLEEALP